MAKIGLIDVLGDPDAAASALEELDCVGSAAVGRVGEDRVMLRVTVLPHDSSGYFIAEGYPIEEVNVVVRSSGQIHAVPKSGKGRTWKHRNGSADLCLWDPLDPVTIRWSWEDGLAEYVRIVARHLIYEEYWRREGRWPVEDSPHGHRVGDAWPVRTLEMRRAARGECRG